jgi:hypothetical protein
MALRRFCRGPDAPRVGSRAPSLFRSQTRNLFRTLLRKQKGTAVRPCLFATSNLLRPLFAAISELNQRLRTT